MPPKRTSTSETPAITLDVIRQLIADLTTAMEAQTVAIARNANKMGILPHCGTDGLLSVEPEAILDRKMAKLNNKVAVYVLVKWANHNEEDAT
ncbi:hypothetical protein Tco_0152456, partial [Tanacetum coccineum]